MNEIFTYFWADRIKPLHRLLWDRHVRGKLWNDFRFGNAGDIFARDLLKHFYPRAVPKIRSEGPRILAIGSIGHQIAPGDVVSGIGCKSAELPRLDPAQIHIHALRGPISLDAFRKAGYDVSKVRFLADPGLMISEMVPSRSAKRGRVIFIPHYRERKQVLGSIPKGIRYVDVDAPIRILARQIQQAECVYSSSLHGIIFAHALGRPCVYVKPMTREPLLKFEDYFLSMNITPPAPLGSIAEADFSRAPNSPPSLPVKPSDIVFPDADFLRSRGVIA